MINHKKIVLLLVVIICLSGCSLGQRQTKLPSKQEEVKDNEGKEFVEPYVDENPIQLALYSNQNGIRTLVTSYDSSMTQYQDIASFEVYYTKEPTLINGSQKNVWSNYYQNYTDIDQYKIGYHITFETEGQKIDQTILGPHDVESFFDYIQVYLYDDIHQESSWYDHITQEEVTEETKFTSIKLTASTQIATITSPITLTVFTYHEGDFDENGAYRGKSSYQITINRK